MRDDENSENRLSPTTSSNGDEVTASPTAGLTLSDLEREMHAGVNLAFDDLNSLPPSYSEFIKQTGYKDKLASAGATNEDTAINIGQIEPYIITPPPEDGYYPNPPPDDPPPLPEGIATVSYSIPYLQLALFRGAGASTAGRHHSRHFGPFGRNSSRRSGSTPPSTPSASTLEHSRRKRVVISCSLASLGALTALIFFIVLFCMRSNDLDTANNLQRLATGYFPTPTTKRPVTIYDDLATAITKGSAAKELSALDSGLIDVNAHAFTGPYCNEYVENATALILATACKSVSEILLILLDRGAEVNARDEAGWSSLIWAAIKGDSETTELLLDKGAQIDARTKAGNSAVVLAAANGHPETARMLLQRGASRDGCDAKVCRNL